jgi:hypothetical protein
MYAYQAQTASGTVVGYYICNESDVITHAWENPYRKGDAYLQKLVAENPLALFVLAEKVIAENGLKEKPAYLVKTFGLVSDEYVRT